MRKRKIWLISVVLLLLAAGGGCIACAGCFSSASLAEEPPQPTLETATVQQGDIVITADGSGELVPASELELAFRTSGVLDEVLVDVGDLVQEDDLLARLESEDLERAVANADVEVELAQLDLAETREGATDAELADASAAVRGAQVELELAQKAYEKTLESGLDAAVERAKLQRDWYVSYYQSQKSEYEDGGLSQSDHDHAMNAMISAEGRYNEAVNEALTEEAQAKNRVTQAQNAVYQAWENLQLLQSEPVTDTLVQAELAVDQALLEREVVRLNLEAAQLYAPFGGTVMEVSTVAGEQVNTTTPILTLADLGEPLVCFWVEESDLGQVVVGSRVDVVFEALPDDTFGGEVIRVDPMLVTVDNTDAVQAWASIDLGAQGVDLLAGMTAEVEIVAAEARDALLVPVEALRETSPGQYAVFVVRPDGEVEMHAVTVGLRDAVNAEILTGLELGDVVSIGEME